MERLIRLIKDTYKDRKANTIILAIYLSFILITQIVVSEFFCMPYLVIGAVLIIGFSLMASPLLISLFSRFSIKDDKENKVTWKQRAFFYGIPLVVLIIHFIAYDPGGFGNDALAQIEQYLTGVYMDWHPVLQTLLTIYIPIKLSEGWIGSIILSQIMVFSIALGYCFETAYRFAGKKYTVVTVLYILLNPLLCFALNAWKDVSFCIGVMFLMSFSLNIVMSKGQWLKKIPNMIFFVVAFTFTTIFRHNAILFTVPLLFALMFHVSKKRFVAVLLSVIALFAVIKGPFYSLVKVENPPRRQVETVGLPLTVIGAAVTSTPEKLDEDILEFAYGFAPREAWEEYYVTGNFNSIKWVQEASLDAIEEYDTSSIMDMMVRCFNESPEVCAASLVKLTEGLYTVTDPHYTDVTPFVVDNYYAIPKIPDKSPLLSLFYAFHSFVDDFVPHVFLYLGVAVLLVIISVLSKYRLGVLKDWKRILFAVPVLAYNFGTAVLLTGFNDCPRFFSYTVFILPLILIFFYRKEEVCK